MANTFPKPGRGSWTLTGGLLPVRPGHKSRTGYYRIAGPGELPIGSAWVTGRERTHEAECVWLGVQAIQNLLSLEPDGWLGPVTDKAIQAVQRRGNLAPDGIVGPVTMRVLLDELIRDACGQLGIPVEVLGGVLMNESGLDPAAVGVNGLDHGLAQINLGVHDVIVPQALDPGFAIHWTAEDLAHVHATWAGRTTADPWDIAIASHNSPLLAKQWAVVGTPPVVKGRVFQIQEYVQKVREAW